MHSVGVWDRSNQFGRRRKKQEELSRSLVVRASATGFDITLACHLYCLLDSVSSPQNKNRMVPRPPTLLPLLLLLLVCAFSPAAGFIQRFRPLPSAASALRHHQQQHRAAASSRTTTTRMMASSPPSSIFIVTGSTDGIGQVCGWRILRHACPPIPLVSSTPSSTPTTPTNIPIAHGLEPRGQPRVEGVCPRPQARQGQSHRGDAQGPVAFSWGRGRGGLCGRLGVLQGRPEAGAGDGGSVRACPSVRVLSCMSGRIFMMDRLTDTPLPTT